MDQPSSQEQPRTTLALVGTYVPRRCGIGTFTNDLAEAIASHGNQTQTWVVAMNDRPEGWRYPHRVKFEINENRLKDYRLAADFLNMSNVDAVSIQHEYGIYGGEAGMNVLELMRRLRMPVITTMHTVLREPEEHYRRATLALARESDRLVVLSEKSVEFLREIYDVPEEKISLIPHGIHDVPFVDPNFYKDQFGVAGRKVILTFGLLSPGKGIERMIDAMPGIVKENPDAVYIVLGATHPAILAQRGEEYRNSLERRAQELGVADNVIFYNKFVDKQELIEFLGCADVYVTPYPNEAQVVSGTLAYALGAGKAVVSTPYWYAEEMLADDRGRIVPFKDPGAMAETINELFREETHRHAMRKNAYTYTRSMVWDSVAEQYEKLIEEVDRERSRRPRPMATQTPLTEPTQELVEIKLDHLKRLTDDTGIFQHAKITVPNRFHGYCVDDNCRALIAVLLAQDHVPGNQDLDRLASTYLSFIHYAFNDDVGRFRNFMGYDRQWLEDVGSEDSHARTLWSLGECVAHTQQRGHLTLASHLFHKALPAVLTFEAPRSWAYSLIGIHAYLEKFGGESQVRRVRETLANRLYQRFKDNACDDWPWLENKLTYGNARLPHALLLSGQWMFKNEMIEMALNSLNWLMDVQTDEKGHFSPVGCEGWFPRDGRKARFDQQPIEAMCSIHACLEAYRVTRENHWVDHAYRALNWFLGDNDLQLPLYDSATGGGYDGLEPQGVNENQGAESTLAWLISLLLMYDYHLEHNGGVPERRIAQQAGAIARAVAPGSGNGHGEPPSVGPRNAG